MAALELVSGERQPGETRKSIQACNDYCRMGPGRSLEKLNRMYTESRPESPPTKNLQTLKVWSSKYGWVARAEAYDAEIERQKNEALALERQRQLEARRKIMESGFAIDAERVKELDRLTKILIAELEEIDDEGERGKLWVKDVKGVGYGEDSQIVKIRRFNAGLIRELRGVLDDLAKEVGDRRQRSDNVNIDLSNLSDEQLQRIANGEDPFYVVATPGQSGNRTAQTTGDI